MLKIAFDVGGVLSKYPKQFNDLIAKLHYWTRTEYPVELYVISDMHPVEKIEKMLEDNGFLYYFKGNVYSADYNKYGEFCKAKLCKELDIDIFFDDFMGYLSDKDGAKIRLLVMPNSDLPYYSESWKSDDKFDFLRRKNA